MPLWPYVYSSITTNKDVCSKTDRFARNLTPDYETKFEGVKMSETSAVQNTIIQTEDQHITDTKDVPTWKSIPLYRHNTHVRIYSSRQTYQ